MGTLILRLARSAQDAVHKKPQPLGSLMLGDSHDRLKRETVGVGGKKQERRPLLNPKFSGSHSEISSFYLPTDSGIIPAQYFGPDALEHCRSTFKHITIQMILISHRPVCAVLFFFQETKQNRFLWSFNIAGDVVCLQSEMQSSASAHEALSDSLGTFSIDD